MERFDNDWDSLARYAGYLSERDMLEDLYITQKLSMKQIGVRVGCSSHAVMHHLEKFGIDRRSRGGNNNTASQTRKLFRLDQRVVLFGDLHAVAKAAGVSVSLLWKYRKSVKEDLPWNSVYCPRVINSTTQDSAQDSSV